MTKLAVFDPYPLGRPEEFGGKTIIRPPAHVDLALRLGAEDHLRSRYRPGRYTDADTINGIFQHQFAFHEAALDQALSHVASFQMLEFVLQLYEEASEVERLAKGGELAVGDLNRWVQLSPILRRGLKFLAEKLVQSQPWREREIQERDLPNVWSAISSAERLVELYTLSDQTMFVTGDESCVEIMPPGEDIYIDHDFSIPCLKGFVWRIGQDRDLRARYLPRPTFDFDTRRHRELLNDAFKLELGVSYSDAMLGINALIQGAERPKGRPPIPCFSKDEALASLSGKLGCSRKVTCRILDGFSIRKARLQQENREIFRPKQEHRAFRRGFFEIGEAKDTRVMFSPSLAKEALTLLAQGIVFQRVPPEWTGKEIGQAVAAVSREASRWLEDQVAEGLNKRGFWAASRVGRKVGMGQEAFRIPERIGEMDVVGYGPSQGLLVVCECKMVWTGSEPRHFRDEIAEFVEGDKSYFAKFARKLEWTKQHAGQLCAALESRPDCRIRLEPTQIAGVMVTMYPTVASCFADEFPCVSATEFLRDVDASATWPYKQGLMGVG